MYCLSVFDTEIEFNSVLSMSTDDFIQSDLLHVIWGFSKVIMMAFYRSSTSVTDSVSFVLKMFIGSMFGELSHRGITHTQRASKAKLKNHVSIPGCTRTDHDNAQEHN